MRIKEGFLLREVAGSFVVIAAGDEALDFNGVITINEVGALIWNKLKEGKNVQEIVADILAEYDVDEKTALDDCNGFIKTLLDNGIAVED